MLAKNFVCIEQCHDAFEDVFWSIVDLVQIRFRTPDDTVRYWAS